MKQILIIEDDEFNCLIYNEILSNEFTNIDFAYDGQQGINKFRGKTYDLILLDLGLPLIGGLQVSKLIREHELKQFFSNRTPLIVITANNFPGTRQEAIMAGVDEYLTKPFDIRELQKLADLYLQKEHIKTEENLM